MTSGRRVTGLVVVALGIASPQAGFIALVLGADRQEAAVRVADVDHDRLVVLRTHLPDRIEALVVGLDVGAVGVLQVEAEDLVDLQAGRAGEKIALELGGRLRRPARLVDAVEVQPGKLNDAIAEGLADLHRAVELGTESAVHVADHAEAGLVHHLDHLVIVVGGLQFAAVDVEVDRRELGPGDGGPGELHQRLRHGGRLGRRLEVGMRREARSLRARRVTGHHEECNKDQWHRPRRHGSSSRTNGFRYKYTGTDDAHATPDFATAGKNVPPPTRLAGFAPYVEGMTTFGYEASLAPWIGLSLLVSTITMLIPRTAMFGCILVTGYLGGAVATQVRVQHDAWFLFPVALGVAAWLGLFLRDARVRALVPFRT